MFTMRPLSGFMFIQAHKGSTDTYKNKMNSNTVQVLYAIALDNKMSIQVSFLY